MRGSKTDTSGWGQNYITTGVKIPLQNTILEKLVEEKYLDGGALKDEFKNPYNYEPVAVDGVKDQDYYLSSSGPDKIKGTEDDIQAPIGDHSFVHSDR